MFWYPQIRKPPRHLVRIVSDFNRRKHKFWLPHNGKPKKIDCVGRRGQKQPKLGILEGTNIGQFWLFLAPPADPVKFFWFKMAGKGVPHIVLMFYVGPAPLGGLLGPNSQLFQK